MEKRGEGKWRGKAPIGGFGQNEIPCYDWVLGSGLLKGSSPAL